MSGEAGRHINCITINTDASFHPQQKVGGYAFWIICDLFKMQKGGMFKKHPKHSTEAEIMCIANALSTLLAQKELPTAKLLIINSDSLQSFDRIRLKSPDKIGAFAANILKDVRKRMGSPKFEFRHVKAHSGVQDARSWVNRWCDTEAKKWMRLAIEENIKEPQQ